MSELEKMQKYIERTRLPNLHNYQMDLRTMRGLKKIPGSYDQVVMAFEYGLAKGWRAVKARARK